MLVRKLATIIFALGVLGITRAALAQGSAGQEKDKTIVDRLDDLGKTIFGGLLPEDNKIKAKDAAMPKTGARAPSRKPVASEPPDDADVSLPSGRRAGSVLAGSATVGRASTSDKTAGDVSDMMPENTPPATPRTADRTLKPVRRPVAGVVLQGESDTPEQPKQQVLLGPPRQAASDQSVLRPLHERLSTFRQSAFGSDGAQEPRPQPNLPLGRASEAPAVKPAGSELGTAKPAGRPIIAQRTRPELDVGEVPAAELVLDPAANSPTKAEKTITAVQKTPAAVETPHAAAKPESDSGLLITRKGPVLSVETLGPRRIAVGRESAYEVGIVNSGEVAAEDMVVFVSLPEWAEVASAEVSSGAAQASATAQATGAVQWKLGHLDAKGRERMTLKIIPRQSRPFDLAVRWEYRPVASQAMIEVQEAKLALQLEGPREVLYGKKETYRLHVANVGNGNAENVAIMLMPIGGGENVPATHKIGLLPAGEEKALDVELTARQAGNLTIQLDARAEGGVHAELAEKVLVRRAGLKIDVDGPKMQFMGVAASYIIRVRNPGTAPARNVNLSIVLPAGSKYLAGLEDARVDASGSKVQWTIETLGPEVEQSFVLKCNLGAAGVNRVQVNAAAEDDLTASTAADTRVESVANLAMDVLDPEGPVAVGDEATYEVRVRNRGTKEAAGVEVFAYFSRGIEPTGAEGGPNRVTPGQVTFQPIASLAPGAEVVFKVRARAEAAGNHIFRAEAHCRPLGTRLIREATNLYYTDVSTTQQTARGPGGDGPAPEAMRTVTRPVQGENTAVPPRK